MPQVLSRLQTHSHSYIQDRSDQELKVLHANSVKSLVKKESIDPNKLIISGYLYKKSQRYHNYKKRWFVLRNCQLSCYKDESEHKPLAIIHGADLLSINVDDQESHHHKSKFYFKIHTNKKELQFYTNDDANLQKWIKGLKSVIAYNGNSVSELQESDVQEQDEEITKKNSEITAATTTLNDHINENNASFIEQYSGSEDPNYTSNASDTNTNHPSYLNPDVILPPISENKVDHEKVETEKLKLKTKLLKRKQVSETDTQPTNENENKLFLDDILSADCPHEIIIEKGQMARLYKRYSQWKKFFVILTNKHLLFYKFNTNSFKMNLDDMLKVEKASKVMKVDDILDIVELEALSKSKPWCLLIITKQKRVRFSVETEDELVKWLVAITMLVNRRKDKTGNGK